MDAVRAQVYNLIDQVQQAPTQLLLAVVCFSVLAFAILLYLGLFIVAPVPRPPHESEKKY
ncbi:hypothetical protein KCU73_g17113, partial [Aureobasidium melanogenum]